MAKLSVMPGRVYITSPLSELALSAQADLRAKDPGPRLDAAPGEDLAVLIDDAGRRVLTEMRWGMVMSGRVNARGRPVMETIINARSETVFSKSAFEGVRWAVLPVNGWYEWTGKTRRKTRWRIRGRDEPVLYFAAIYDVWKGPGGVEVAQMATVTCEPNADVANYHHRMPVLLTSGAISKWLAGPEANPALVEPPQAGRLVVEEAEEP